MDRDRRVGACGQNTADVGAEPLWNAMDAVPAAGGSVFRDFDEETTEVDLPAPEDAMETFLRPTVSLRVGVWRNP